MQNLPISAHITVVSATPASPADASTLASGAATPGRDSDFSNLLASQLAARVDALPHASPEAGPDGAGHAATAEAQAPTDPSGGLAVIAFVPFVAPAEATSFKPGDVAQGRADRTSGSTRTLTLPDDRGVIKRPDGLVGGEKPATEPPANLAATDAQLPAKAPARAVADLAPAIEPGAAKLQLQPQPSATELTEVPPGWSAHAVVAAKNETAAPVGPTSGTTTVSVDARVGNPAWGTELGQKVVWLANQHQQIAHINVTPPQLGPIEIRLNLAHDQASATFVSPHAAVRDAIEAALPRLRDMLAESGLTLGNVDVSAHSFGHARQDHAQQGASSRSMMPEQVTAVAGLIGAPLGAGLGAQRGGEGLVDIFA